MTGRLAARSLLASLFALALAQTAHADVIGPGSPPPPRCPPLTCPSGAEPWGLVGHGTCGNGCRPPPECGPTAPCPYPDQHCEPRRWCIEQMQQGRMIADTVHGECADDGSCARGVCSEAGRCIAVPPTDVPPTETSTAPSPASAGCSSCAVTSRAGRGPIAIAIGVLVGMSGVRRRRLRRVRSDEARR